LSYSDTTYIVPKYTISYSTFTGNKTAHSSLTTYTVGVINLSNFNNNNIYGNLSADYEFWNDKNDEEVELDATYNWWGTTDESEIEEKIYNLNEDSSKNINYSPYETDYVIDAPISPPRDLTATATDIKSGEIELSWTANEESDISGYMVYWGKDGDYNYSDSTDAGNVTNYTITGLSYNPYFSVTAYDIDYTTSDEDPETVVNDNMTNGHESWYSEAEWAEFSDTSAEECPDPTETTATKMDVDPGVEFELSDGNLEDIIATVTNDSECPVEDVNVKLKIKKGGKNIVVLCDDKKKTDENGQATFTIVAYEEDGKTKINFKAKGSRVEGKLKEKVKIYL